MNSKFTNIIDLKNFLENKENFEKFNFPEIACYANNLVFSKGNPNAKILIIGEAPGEKEDISSIPFCGSCGKLLDSALRTFLNNPEDSVYFINDNNK